MKRLLSGATAVMTLAVAIPAMALVVQANVGVQGHMDGGPGMNMAGQAGMQMPGEPADGPGRGMMMGSTTYGTSTHPWPHGTSTQAYPHTYPEIKPAMISGNVIFGTVVSVSGNIITVTGNTGKGPGMMGTSTAQTTYTVDATNATFLDSNGTTTLSSIAPGDHVMVEGMINANLVVATTVHDGVMQKENDNDGSNTPPQGHGGFGGFMMGIGSFFKHLFHF